MKILKMLFGKLAKNLSIVIVIVAIIVGGTFFYFSYQKDLAKKAGEKKAQTAQDIGNKVIKYINDKILQGKTTATLVSVAEENGLYKLVFKIQDQEITSYTNMDGTLLFAEPIKMEEQTADQNQGTQDTQQQNVPTSDKPSVKLFIMSFCPYGNQAEELMMQVVKLLGDKANIEPHYVIYSNYGGGGPNYCADKDNKYCSMHGIQEVNQDVRELCVWKYQKDKYWDFLKEVNKSCTSQNADACWENVAKNLGIDTAKIKTCQRDESLSLLAAELDLTKKLGVSGSPQIFINDVEYKGERSAEAYKKAICAAFKSAPGECSQTLSSSTSGASNGGCE